MSNTGKKLQAHYVGTLDDGTVFDSSLERGEPIEFICGAGQMIPGFDAAVQDMVVGETKTVRIPPEEAYGMADPEMIYELPIGQIAGLETVPIGETILLQGPGLPPQPAKVVAKSATHITLDLNHQLAGQALNFDITLVAVSD